MWVRVSESECIHNAAQTKMVVCARISSPSSSVSVAPGAQNSRSCKKSKLWSDTYFVHTLSFSCYGLFHTNNQTDRQTHTHMHTHMHTHTHTHTHTCFFQTRSSDPAVLLASPVKMVNVACALSLRLRGKLYVADSSAYRMMRMNIKYFLCLVNCSCHDSWLLICMACESYF